MIKLLEYFHNYVVTSSGHHPELEKKLMDFYLHATLVSKYEQNPESAVLDELKKCITVVTEARSDIFVGAPKKSIDYEGRFHMHGTSIRYEWHIDPAAHSVAFVRAFLRMLMHDLSNFTRDQLNLRELYARIRFNIDVDIESSIAPIKMSLYKNHLKDTVVISFKGDKLVTLHVDFAA